MSTDIEQFAELLDLHGADIERWPFNQQAVARDLLDASPEARNLHQEALRLDRALAALPTPPLAPGLATRITALADEPADPWLTVKDWLTATLWRPAAVLMAPMVLGIVVGLSLPETVQDEYVSDYPWVDVQEYTADE